MEGIVNLSEASVKYPSGTVRPLAIARTASDSPRIVEVVRDRGTYIIVAKPLTKHEVPFPRENVFRMSYAVAQLAKDWQDGLPSPDTTIDWSMMEPLQDG